MLSRVVLAYLTLVSLHLYVAHRPRGLAMQRVLGVMVPPGGTLPGTECWCET